MKSFVRDSTIRLKFRFQDADGEIRNPSAAFVTLAYLPLGDYSDLTQETLTLVRQTGTDDWVVEWNSGGARACVVTAHAETLGIPTCSVDTQFRLTANVANRLTGGDL